ncbi:TetR/AcrR family transcriptional regulator [Maritalea sp.]|uniref:TetR/AcrR family transcriptional regulator n=1 Tax=Maritalea sp. TaxID=2003361 RepID=UPI003EF7891B
MNVRVEGKQKRALVTREEILVAYDGLATRLSFDQISIAQIATSAGVGKGTVLAHFSEKLALPATLFARYIESISDRLTANTAKIDKAVLKTILLELLAFIFTDDVYSRLVLGDGQDICRKVIEPSEMKLFELLFSKLDTKLSKLPEVQIETVRALLVHAVVLQRACSKSDEVERRLSLLIDALL